MTERLLQVSNLVASFGQGRRWRRVVDDISFGVDRNETVAIVGESGSGKSVTAMSILRLLNPQTCQLEGDIRFDGRSLLGLSEPAMRGARGNEIAMIFQEPMTSLNPVLTVGLQVSEALQAHRSLSRADADAEAVRLLDRVRIPDAATRARQHPHMLSGGMRQRVMIAMALACNPKLLIADEPTTALDVTIQLQILELIRELQAERDMAVLFITHDMGVVAEIARRCIVMRSGRIVEEGATTEIFRQPREDYTRMLLAAVPKLGSMKGKPSPEPFRLDGARPPAAASDQESRDAHMPAGEPVMSVDKVSVRYAVRAGLLKRSVGRVHAVENVSFDVLPGETLSIVGESGCGKSTLGKAIVGLVTPADGRIAFPGRAETGGAAAARARHVQMIFQDPFGSLNPRKTVGEALARPLRIHGLAGTRAEAHERVVDMLERVGLSADMAERYPHEFSGGQRQRVCIARALCIGPKVIVADEAVSALDVSVKAQVVDLMMDLQRSMGLSYLFVSHDMAVVERVSHRVAVMYLGEIVEIGPRASIFERPAHAYTKRLLSAVPNADPFAVRERRTVPEGEVKSRIRGLDHVAPERRYTQVGEAHFVAA